MRTVSYLGSNGSLPRGSYKAIFMVQAAEDRTSHYLQVPGNVVPVFLERRGQDHGWLGNAWPQRYIQRYMRITFIIRTQ
jgi:hypothetical protein